MADKKSIIGRAGDVFEWATNPVGKAFKTHRENFEHVDVANRLSKGDPEKAKYYASQYTSFVMYEQTNEVYHTGSFTSGFVEGGINGFVAAPVAGRIVGKDIETILRNGGSFQEFEAFKKAAGEDTDVFMKGDEKKKLDVTLGSYAEFTKVAAETAKKEGIPREAIVRDTIKDLKKDGDTLKDSTKELKKDGVKQLADEIREELSKKGVRQQGADLPDGSAVSAQAPASSRQETSRSK